MLKKNSNFSRDFNYNMSGLELVYNGKQLVKEEEIKTVKDAYNQGLEANNTVNFVTSFSYKFKPSFKIKSVAKNSPAEEAGLQKDDIILHINGIQTHELNLGSILEKLQDTVHISCVHTYFNITILDFDIFISCIFPIII